ncbi:MAG TPA: cytochrome c [Vicinamibacterales bacterium]
MKRTVILALSAIAFVMATGTASAQDAAKIAKGKAAYAASTCKMCHSIDGVGNAKGPLDSVGAKLTPAEIKEWLTDPVGMTAKTKSTRTPAMKLTKPIPAEDVDAMVAYLSTLKKK